MEDAENKAIIEATIETSCHLLGKFVYTIISLHSGPSSIPGSISIRVVVIFKQRKWPWVGGDIDLELEEILTMRILVTL